MFCMHVYCTLRSKVWRKFLGLKDQVIQFLLIPSSSYVFLRKVTHQNLYIFHVIMTQLFVHNTHILEGWDHVTNVLTGVKKEACVLRHTLVWDFSSGDQSLGLHESK